MLAHLSSYHDYIDFLSSISSSDRFHLDEALRNRSSQSALFKMIHLDVDSIQQLLAPLYSHTGRPAINQIEIIRSFVLMLHFHYTSIKKWAAKLRSTTAYAILIGCSPDSTPAASNHYDFINRIFRGFKYQSIFPPGRYSKPKDKKPKKNEKWENMPLSATDEAVDYYLSGNDDSDRPELILQQLFNLLAVDFSVDHQLIDTSKPICLSGDGTAYHVIDSTSRGTRIIKCEADKDDPDCLRHYSDPEANFGWDSDLRVFYFGYNAYNISYHNNLLKIDIPLFLSMDRASIHDSLNAVTAFSHFRSVNSSIDIKYYCLDSASDNYASHRFFAEYGIIPIIDINKRKEDENPFEKFKGLSPNGKPLCPENIEMVYWGHELRRHRSKYRCPLAVNKIDSCSHCQECRKSDYGKTTYIKTSDDPRLFGPVPYKSDKWKEIYKNRSSCERTNTRTLNDYKLASCTTRTRPRRLFMQAMGGINIHLDAFEKVSKI